MGTQGSITVYDEQGKDIANIVTQYDGHGLSDWVARFVSGKQLTNGISNDYDFNGMGDLAARLIAALKNQRYKSDMGQPVKPGNVYLYDTPYETDYHITLVYQGEGKKPKMTVSTPEWTDNYYDSTVLPDVGEQNVQMQGAETFDAESKKMCIVCNEKPVDYSHPNTLGALCSTPKCLHYVFDAETFGADYSLYDRKTKQKVGVKSGYHDYKDAYDDWEEEIVNKYPNRVSENEWIVIDTHSAETFGAENETMVHQIISPYEPGGYATTYIYRDEKDLKDALWDMASSRMFEYEEEFPEYDWEGSLDSAENQAIWDKKTKNMSINKIMEYAMLDDDNQYSKVSLNLDGFRIDGEYGGVENMTLKGGILSAETFNSYKVAPALSSYTKDELISSKAGPQGSASYDEMVYDPIAQDRLSAESFASDEDKRLKAFAKKIENEKKKLVKKAKRSGLYENFGQKEVHKLEDSISDLDYYERQKYKEMIRDFENWANSIDLRGLERYAESFASDEYRLCEICESTHHENSFSNSDDEEQTMTPKGKVCDVCFGDILFDDFQNADDRDWAKQYLESKGFQPHTIEGSFEDGFGAESFASETSSTLKSMGYVAGTIGVGYLLFQRFVKDRLDETMNQ